MINWRRVALTAILVGALARLSVYLWHEPWTPHHPDEDVIQLESLALWEGITPREIGWPGSTTRLILSGAEAIRWAVDRGGEAWAARHEPLRAMTTISTWIGEQYVRPGTMFRLGRTLSILAGIAQLFVAYWALTRWLAPRARALGMLAVALSPIVVVYSQYVLADIMGVLFATVIVGLSASPSPRRILSMAALAGLAAGSKFHFGVWLLTPLICAHLWDGPDVTPRRRLTLMGASIGIFAVVLVALVPWFLIDPVLTVKELGGVIGSKIGSNFPLVPALRAFPTLFAGVGLVGWAGAILALFAARRDLFHRLAPVAIPLIVATVALVTSAVVFNRYALVLVPGLVMISAIGWDFCLAAKRRQLAALALTVSLGITAWELVTTQRNVAVVDVDVQTRSWILAHVPRGQRVAVQNEWLVWLPRTAAQLRECAQYVASPEAYQEKWQVEGAMTELDLAQPMRSALLTDEAFSAYWCRRELSASRDPGYPLVLYNSDRRFRAILERDAIAAFIDPSGGVDVLVLNRPVALPVAPAATLTSPQGQRVIYVRTPGREDAGPN